MAFHTPPPPPPNEELHRRKAHDDGAAAAHIDLPPSLNAADRALLLDMHWSVILGNQGADYHGFVRI